MTTTTTVKKYDRKKYNMYEYYRNENIRWYNNTDAVADTTNRHTHDRAHRFQFMTDLAACMCVCVFVWQAITKTTTTTTACSTHNNKHNLRRALSGVLKRRVLGQKQQNQQ